MSCVKRKPAFSYAKKDTNQLFGNYEANQRLCFRYTDSTIPLISKSDIPNAVFQKRFSGYLSRDIEADLPVAYIGLQLVLQPSQGATKYIEANLPVAYIGLQLLLQPSQGATKLVEVTLQYDVTKLKPE